jgi:triosephosphate isomerase (TIM)
MSRYGDASGGSLSRVGKGGRPALLAANWKMNPATATEAAQLARGIVDSARAHAAAVQTAIFPPFPWLVAVADVIKGAPVSLGAQNSYWERAGAFTGEVSAAMLRGWCQWLITGHSERRAYFGETDEMVSRKTGAALVEGLKVIVCVGEPEETFAAGRTADYVSRQVRRDLDRCTTDDAPSLVVAYEPIWAIGTGRSADPEQACETMRLVREVLTQMLGDKAARLARVVYGGSVSARNIASYVELPPCDGCLVGGASLKPDEFSAMIRVVAEVYNTA